MILNHYSDIKIVLSVLQSISILTGFHAEEQMKQIKMTLQKYVFEI